LQDASNQAVVSSTAAARRRDAAVPSLPFSSLVRRDTFRDDAVAGLVLGVYSVPSGLAAGLMAGVSPVASLYAYLVGTFVGAMATSSVFMTVQATGAMATIIADVPEVHAGADPARALYTLSVVTGIMMAVAGLLRLGRLLRWVSNAVMVGFVNAVGVNIVLGQLDTFSGYDAQGPNRLLRALDLLLNLDAVHRPTLAVGAVSIVLILLLERTRLRALGIAVSVALTSLVVGVLGWNVQQLGDITQIPRQLPSPLAPWFAAVPALIVPAAALTFVGLVQGAGISARFPNPDGTSPEPSRDFLGQGLANIAAGLLQGMPVGGSMSATSLVKTAGARSRAANLAGAAVMAASILLLAPLVAHLAMPALAGLLIVVGIRTVKPAQIHAMWRTGPIQATVMAVTFTLTMLIPVQNAVLVGVGISVILHVIRQSNRVTIKRWLIDDRGRVRETNPPPAIGTREVVVLMPYGSLFFASAPLFEKALPQVTPATERSVVILRLRGQSDVGATFLEVLVRYAQALRRANSRLMIVADDGQMLEQFTVTGVTEAVGAERIFKSSEWIGATVADAHRKALDWVNDR
jgi:SulP family sulfate permease